ncbi:MAG: [FeFe] hydrogenase, group A [Firmicutes bacterium]|nr:[FeFe] hydrogenase, group A [Bacillota bacterium]
MKIKIDGKEYKVKGEKTILEVCADVGINIPNLCYSKNLGLLSSCRVCVVEVEGRWNLVPACGEIVRAGMVINTNSPRVINARKTILELLLSDHELKCISCSRTTDCRLKLASEAAQCDAERFQSNPHRIDGATHGSPPHTAKSADVGRLDKANNYVRRNPNKCILCGRCVKVCAEHQEVGVLAVNGRGFDAHIGVAWGNELGSVPCITCGQCVVNCPTAALEETSAPRELEGQERNTNVEEIKFLREKLGDKGTHVIVATAPSTRVAIGEAFGLPSGTNAEGKMVAVLKRLGFDRVFDLNLAADFTIMEEGTELLKRLHKMTNYDLKTRTFINTQFTSCCPAWINYVQMMHPELLPNVSTTKSPQQIFGALAKTYYAQKMGIDPKNIFVVMLMPCIAKSSEANREGIDHSKEFKDVDMSITVRQLSRMVREAGIDFAKLKNEKYDDPLGLSSGAGLIFGTTGGVSEAALRTISEKMLCKRLNNVNFENIRGEQGIKVAEIDTIQDSHGNPIRVAVVSGIANAERVIKDIKSGRENYHFVEVMACPGGCVNGGGMPVHNDIIQDNFANARRRASTMYNMDQYNNLRRAHDNPVVKQIYKEFLGEPNGEIAYKLLHTTYKPRKKYD